MHRWRRLGTALVLVVGLLFGVPSHPASAVSSDAAAPPGVNNWSCKPSRSHPRPVILVHGIIGNGYDNWVYLAPMLIERGYCVYSLTYGVSPQLAALASTPFVPGGFIPIEDSAREFGAFVTKVQRATGASKVDLVGHSEGTLVPQYWLKFYGGAGKVSNYVAMTPIYHGTTVSGVSDLVNLGYQYGISQPAVGLFSNACSACSEFLVGSAFMKKLQPAGVRGVRYTTIMTKYDELVVPYTSGYMAGAVHNWVLQDLCPADVAEHGVVAFDPVAAQLTFNALDPARAHPVDCNLVPGQPVPVNRAAPTTPPESVSSPPVRSVPHHFPQASTGSGSASTVSAAGSSRRGQTYVAAPPSEAVDSAADRQRAPHQTTATSPVPGALTALSADAPVRRRGSNGLLWVLPIPVVAAAWWIVARRRRGQSATAG